MEESDILALVQEQEQIAKRSLDICALLRQRCDPHASPPHLAEVSEASQTRPAQADGMHKAAEKANDASVIRRQETPPQQSPQWSPQRSPPDRSPERSRKTDLREPLLGGKGNREQKAADKRRMFPNREALKDELKSRLREGPISSTTEHDLYYESGICPLIARSSLFETITFLIITLNMLWIGIDADYNHAQFLYDAPIAFQIVENAFCFFFAFELAVRFNSFRNKQDCLTEKWFMFDVVLVTFMVWDTWIINGIYILLRSNWETPNTQALRVLRLIRITRVARLARLLRFVPEFMILVKGVWMALRSVFSTLCLLLIIMYVFAILFTELLAGTDDSQGCFESVAGSMNCLLVDAVFPDQADLIAQMLNAGLVYYFIHIIFLVLASMTALNMLIGVMCELMGTTAEYEREAIAIDQVKETVNKILPAMGAEGHSTISEEEFIQFLDTPEAMRALSEVDVDVIALVDFAEYVFRGREEISFGDFMCTIMKFRGGQQATVKDIVDAREFLAGEIKEALRALAASNLQASWGRL